MSVRASTWAWEQGRVRGLVQGQLLTLLKVADHADNDGVCWPGEKQLAEYTVQDTRTVRRHLKQLEEGDVLHRERRAAEKGRGRARDRILLHLDQPGNLSGESATTNRTNNDDQPDTGRTRTNKGTVREPSKAEERSKKKVGSKVVSDVEFDLATAVVASFNATAGTKLSVDPHLTPIVGRIRERPDLTAEHHATLIEAVFAGDHWWSGPPGPRIIYGNAAQFEQSLELARAYAGEKRDEAERDPNAELRRVRKEQGLDD